MLDKSAEMAAAFDRGGSGGGAEGAGGDAFPPPAADDEADEDDSDNLLDDDEAGGAAPASQLPAETQEFELEAPRAAAPSAMVWDAGSQRARLSLARAIANVASTGVACDCPPPELPAKRGRGGCSAKGGAEGDEAKAETNHYRLHDAGGRQRGADYVSSRDAR